VTPPPQVIEPRPAIIETALVQEIDQDEERARRTTEASRAVRRFDFNLDQGPTAAGFIGISNAPEWTYSPERGYGWGESFPAPFDDGKSDPQNAPDLNRDGAQIRTPVTFLVNVDPDTMYDVRIHLGNRHFPTQAQVRIEDVTQKSPAIGNNRYETLVFSEETAVYDADADGKLEIEIRAAGTKPEFAWVNGIDIAVAGQLPAEDLKATAYGSGSEPLTENDLKTAFDGALARLTAEGIESDMIDELRTIPVRIADLDGVRLGHLGINELLIDTNASGMGWYVDPTPLDDTEFDHVGEDGLRYATRGAAADGVDLMSVILHELSHRYSSRGLVKSSTLPSGAREAARISRVFAPAQTTVARRNRSTLETEAVPHPVTTRRGAP